MRVFEIPEFGIDKLREAERPTPQPGAGQVLVRLKAASLNFRDLMVTQGTYNPRLPFPRIPLSDGAGVVESVGAGVTRFKPGDRVTGIFMEGWIDGRIDKQKANTALGGAVDGVLCEYRVFHEESLVATPDHLSDVEAACLPCAAVTAWHALFEQAPARAGDAVVIQGTGGVAIFALQFAHAAGLRTIVLSSSDQKLERARSLGATDGINYRSEPDWEKAVLKILPEGADYIVELGGAETLPRSLKAIRMGGLIAVIGVLTGVAPTVDPRPILMNSTRVQGIYVGSRAMFERMNRAIALHGIKPVIDRVFPWQQAREAMKSMAEQSHFGKVALQF